MGLKNIIEAYKLTDESMNFLHELKEKHITRSDFEKGFYPELSDLFNKLDKQGKRQMNEHPVLTTIAAIFYSISHPKKTISGQKYYQSAFGGINSVK